MPKQSDRRFNLCRFFKESAGGVLVYVAVVMPLFIGIVGLGVDVSVWHTHKRVAQTIADAAALGAVYAVVRSGDETTGEAGATQMAITNGYDESAGYDMTVNNPPTSGEFTSSDDAWEVLIRRSVPTYLASMVFDEQAFVSARSVALVGTNNGCVIALARIIHGRPGNGLASVA